MLELATAGELAPRDPRLIHERGRIYADWGRWDEAAADFTSAIAGVPDGPARATILTPIWEELLRWDPVFIRVVELRPEDHGPWVTRGNARARRADWKGPLPISPRPSPCGLRSTRCGTSRPC